MEDSSKFVVLSVGQCGADEPRIRALLKKLGVGRIDQAHSNGEALQLCERHHYDLILINRILDATGESGHTLVVKVLHSRPKQAVMLVSNYAEAQREAVALGALHGFGKNELSSPSTVTLLQKALAGERE
jgi:DNA-binding NarL/FixJ family response regulator